jgi:ZIP family zinc transporter
MNPIVISIISLSIIALGTTLGSSLVFFLKKTFSNKISAIIMGFASGIMIAAGFLGLLIPAIEEATLSYDKLAVIPVIIGFLLGGILLFLLDKLIPHIHINTNEEEGNSESKISKNLKFFLAVTIHNIPEGLAVGFALGLAFKSDASNMDSALISALTLAIGMCIQNIPEGAAISVPMLKEGISKPKAFFYGFFSGIVEPIFGILGLLLASNLVFLLPWLLAFSAGAMIYVTVDELLPSMREHGHYHLGIWAFMIGLSIMMVLELVL